MQSHSSNTSLPQTLSSNSNHPFPLPTSQNLPQTSNLPPGSISHDPYSSLHPSFQNFPVSSFQPPNLPPNPCPPPQTSTHPFNTLTSLPSSPGLLMIPSIPFAALSDPFKLFDGLDHTYPPEKLLARLSARVTFELGPQHLNIQPYLTWHSRGISLLHCSLTGTASNWYDRLPQEFKNDLSSKFSKNNFIVKSMQIMPNLRHFLSLKKVRMFDTML